MDSFADEEENLKVDLHGLSRDARQIRGLYLLILFTLRTVPPVGVQSRN